MREARRRNALFDQNCLHELEHRVRTDRRRALRILKLIEAVLRDPFGGPGKPEPLRGQLAGSWSRRIDQEHRLVYRVDTATVRFIAARYHYGS
ncbi:MAG: Txe/YoeB family addiction module toxin [Spirochaetaceae bacterium]|nr:Txe/YoeB family addiction module toxin [Spirochaetaceae bacterium]